MSLTRNTAANLAGRLWVAVLGVVLIPVYVNQLGIESYALVGFHATLQSLFLIVDFGLGAAFSREVARLSALEGTQQEQRDLLLTLNVAYWFLAVVAAAVVWLAAPLIATRWLHAEKLASQTLIISLRLMGLAIAVQFPTALYQGGLLGLQRQVAFNVILVSTSTVRSIGMILVLYFISATIESFFIWQVTIVAVTLAVYWVVLDRALPASTAPAAFSYPLLKRTWRYGAGWAGNSIGTAIAQQSDKAILAKTLSLVQFGYYTLAAMAGTLLWTLIFPVTAAAFPRFNQRIALGDERGLADEYDRANQLLAVILMPTAAVLLFFARDIMMIWTGKPEVAAATASLVICFTVGMSLAGLLSVALHVALAYGWFRLILAFTWGAAIVFAPMYWFASRRWGVLGAGVVWALQNGSQLLLVPILHRRHIRGGWVPWLKHALVYPVAATTVVCGFARLLAPTSVHRFVLAAYLAATWMAATIAVVLVEPILRSYLHSFRDRLRPRASVSAQ